MEGGGGGPTQAKPSWCQLELDLTQYTMSPEARLLNRQTHRFDPRVPNLFFFKHECDILKMADEQKDVAVEEEEELDCSSPEVVNKYQFAGQVANGGCLPISEPPPYPKWDPIKLHRSKGTRIPTGIQGSVTRRCWRIQAYTVTL